MRCFLIMVYNNNFKNCHYDNYYKLLNFNALTSINSPNNSFIVNTSIRSFNKNLDDLLTILSQSLM